MINLLSLCVPYLISKLLFFPSDWGLRVARSVANGTKDSRRNVWRSWVVLSPLFAFPFYAWGQDADRESLSADDTTINCFSPRGTSYNMEQNMLTKSPISNENYFQSVYLVFCFKIVMFYPYISFRKLALWLSKWVQKNGLWQRRCLENYWTQF